MSDHNELLAGLPDREPPVHGYVCRDRCSKTGPCIRDAVDLCLEAASEMPRSGNVFASSSPVSTTYATTAVAGERLINLFANARFSARAA